MNYTEMFDQLSEMIGPPKDYSTRHPVIKVLDEKFPYRNWDREVQNYLDGGTVSFSGRIAIERELKKIEDQSFPESGN